MIQKLKVNIMPDDCIIIVHYDELCNLGFELRSVFDFCENNGFVGDLNKLHELSRILFRHYMAIEDIDQEE